MLSQAEGLAQRIIDRDVPPGLIGKLLSLDVGALMAGAKYRGEYEERVKAVLGEIEKASDAGQNIILFIVSLLPFVSYTVYLYVARMSYI